MVNYQLLIQKRHNKARHEQTQGKFSLSFVVIDLDKGVFPLNFVCVLPKTWSNTYTGNGTYSKYFPDRITGLLFAKQLLMKAEKEYTDPEIHEEINSRLLKIEHYLKCDIIRT